MFYIIVYLIIILIGIMLKNKYIVVRDRKVNVFFILVGTILIAIAALRSNNVGKDTMSYYNIFQKINNGISIWDIHTRYETKIEFGYLLLISIIIHISHSRIVFFAIQHTIIIGFTFYFLYKKSCNQFISILMFVAILFTSTMNVTRQYIAVGIVLLASLKFDEKKYREFILLVISAMFVHKSSIVYSILLILSNMINTRKKFLFSEIVVIAIGIILSNKVILKKILSYTGIYTSYLNGKHIEATASSGTIIYIYCLITILGAILSFFYENDNSIIKNTFLCTVGAILGLLSIKMKIFSRIGIYFFIYFEILLPQILQSINIEKNGKKCIEFVIVIALMFATYKTGIGYEYATFFI